MIAKKIKIEKMAMGMLLFIDSLIKKNLILT